jgi:hypothetical protein
MIPRSGTSSANGIDGNSTPGRRRGNRSCRLRAEGRFDLGREIEQLHHEPSWVNGQNAKTLVKYDDLRVVLTALKASCQRPCGGDVVTLRIAGVFARAAGHAVAMKSAHGEADVQMCTSSDAERAYG